MADSVFHTPAADLLTDSAAVNANPWSFSSNLGPSRPDVDVVSPGDSLNLVVEAEDTLPSAQPDLPSIEESFHKPAADSSILIEFDPLASDPVEQLARDAWATAESHPPPPLAKDTSTNSPTSPDQNNAAAVRPSPPTPPRQPDPAISSTFPSLASLARSLALSPRRSITPPLPPPPRFSSLRHNHHASIASIPASSEPAVSPTITIVSNSAPQVDSKSSPVTPNAEGVTITSSSKPDGQFDFQKFLDQMKTKGADPIAKYLRSFLSNFSKKVFTVNDQIKIIHDFLDFIADKMRTMDGSPWQNASPHEFDNAMEAMEKLVMNRLYEFTFQPLLPPQLRTTDDLERDHVFRQRISLFGWLREEHLDVPKSGENDKGAKEVKGFLEFAQQELLKINHYKAPRDKLICILNCCKVIFGLIRHVHLTEGADSFIPILIFVVLKANPEHLLSNIEYINRFRNSSKLQSEAGYYLSSLMGAVSFIETMDHSSLSNISQDEFERNVEGAIQSLPISRPPSPSASSTPATLRTPRSPPAVLATPTPARPSPSPLAGEEAARPLSLRMPSSSDGRNAADPDQTQLSIGDDTRRFFQRTSDTISKPLTAIGRIFSDMLDGADSSTQQDSQRKMGWRDLPGPFAPLSIGSGRPPEGSHPEQTQVPQLPMGNGAYRQTPYKPRIRPSYPNSPANSFASSPSASDTRGPPMTNQLLALGPSQAYRPSPTRDLQVGSPHPSRNPTPTLDFGALQDEIDRAHLAAHDAARETLMQIFPAVDREVAEMVLEANDGDLGRTIEALLEISEGQPAVT